MVKLPDAAEKVPLMFQAQTKGRSQLNFIKKLKDPTDIQDVERWTNEWIERTYEKAPMFGRGVETKEYTFNWRFVTNCGQDDIIRPVIGAKGWPFYPGSSMKGAFRRVCTSEQIELYCGKELAGGEFAPGLLRFHGGYPVDAEWQDNLVDIVHPQQGWQVQTSQKPGGESAFSLISLWEPTFQFGISSNQPESTNWDEVWKLWEEAISYGLGCRVSAGYGQINESTNKPAYSVSIKGQGIAPKLLYKDATPEFRPNIFKAAIRGHALRIFGSLTNGSNAESLVEDLFGGVTGDGKVGLFQMSFQKLNPSSELERFEEGRGEDVYDVKGRLNWYRTRILNDEQKKSSFKLIANLTRFAMFFGGFGKSWRRADHRLFYPEYYNGRERKSLIGCHWEWMKDSLDKNYSVFKVEKVGDFIEKVRDAASEWMKLQGINPTQNNYAKWRESFHPNNVQVWGRIATDEKDSLAIKWLHQPYYQQQSIKNRDLTGKMGTIGRLWHRMYRLPKAIPNPETKEIKFSFTRSYLEILTFFPDTSDTTRQFINYLENQQDSFQKLWGN
jgi:CRISPR-associated protein Cmr6